MPQPSDRATRWPRRRIPRLPALAATVLLAADAPRRMPSGDLAVAVVSPGYEVRVFRAGRLERVIRRPIAPRTPTHEDALDELGDGMRLSTPGGERRCDPSEGLDARGMADAIPVIQQVRFGPFGTLWIYRRGTAKTDGPVDVFSETADYLGTLPTAPMDIAALVGDDRIAAVVKDELDVERVTLYRARRER